MKDFGVMQLVDTLDVGGTERVAVNIANQLSHLGHRSFLCTTRRDGPLAPLVQPDVQHISLNRKRRIEIQTLRRLSRFVSDHGIKILHAHGSSILTANLVSRLKPFPAVIWHDHFGTNRRSEWLYRRLVGRVKGIAAVSQPLADWSRECLGFRRDRVWCVPNFVEPLDSCGYDPMELLGTDGARIVCVANLRPVKDHLMLLAAMKQVVQKRPDAHLLLVGALADHECVGRIRSRIDSDGLSEHVTVLGPRDDVAQILAACDIGVLSSTSEGLPISLLEYGAAGLPVVVTDVGQCAEVVGDSGYVTPPSDPDQLSRQIIKLLNDIDLRNRLGEQFRNRVEQRFGAGPIMNWWLDIYETVLSEP